MAMAYRCAAPSTPPQSDPRPRLYPVPVDLLSVGVEGMHFQLPESAYPHAHPAGAFMHADMYFHGYPHVHSAFQHPLQPELKQPRTVELPSLPGISALNANEIRRDLQDIEDTIVQEEEESDDSVVVEDIIPSSYPVKPRKTPKWPVVGQAQAYVAEDEELEEDFGLEETMELFRIIEKVRPEIFESERSRERMEIQYQSLRDAYVSKCREYGKAKKGQQNLVRVLQAMAARKLAVVSTYHKQNAMMADVINSFRWRAAATEKLKESTHSIRRQLDNAKKRGIPAEDSVNVLDVHLYNDLRKKDTAQESLTLYVGMALRTPFGDGVIDAIRPKAEQVVIQLPFGVLHAKIRNAILWGPFDLASDATLTARWDVLEQKIRMPASYEHMVHTLLPKSSSDEDVFTDKDEDTGPEDEMDIAGAAAAAADGEDADQGAPTKADRKRRAHEHDWPRNLISRDHALLPIDAAGIPLLLAPAHVLPTLIQNVQTQKREHLAFSRAALLPSSEAAVQAKEMMRMRSEFADLTKQIKRLQEEHTIALHRIERNRQQTARTTQQITALRTEMLTRRQRHRSVLSDHGVHEGQLPTTFNTHPKEDDFPTDGTSSLPSNPIDILAALAAPDAPTKRKNDTSDSQESKNSAKTSKRRRA